MKDIIQLLTASEELLDDSDPLDPPDDPMDKRVILAKKLESKGKKPICCGRAMITVERCESNEELPTELKDNWGVVKVSIYSDPDVSAIETPEVIYIDGSRYGLNKLFYDNGHISKEIKIVS